jgi:hypothetical protein
MKTLKFASEIYWPLEEATHPQEMSPFRSFRDPWINVAASFMDRN